MNRAKKIVHHEIEIAFKYTIEIPVKMNWTKKNNILKMSLKNTL